MKLKYAVAVGAVSGVVSSIAVFIVAGAAIGTVMKEEREKAATRKLRSVPDYRRTRNDRSV